MRMATSPIKTESRPPVVHNQRDSLAYTEPVEEPVQVLPVLDEAVRSGSGAGEFVAAAFWPMANSPTRERWFKCWSDGR